MANNDLDSLPIPKELKLETYSKRPQEAEFDRLDLVLELQAGVDGVGAVVKSFRDAIRSHDEAVKLIEDHMAVVEDVKRVYKKKNRLFRNLDAAWNVMLDSGSDFYEYMELLPKMKQVEKRLELTTDPIAKATLLTECERYKVLHPVCSNQLIIYKSYSKAREERDAALRDLVDAESVMYQFRESEKAKAAQISDDHVNADEAKTSLSAVFPSIHGIQFVIDFLR